MISAVGLMSGTSADGISAAWIDVNRKLTLRDSSTYRFSAKEQKRIHALRDATTAEICEANMWLGGLFARGALNEEFWEELEEALIVADVGMDTTLRLANRVREQADSGGVTLPLGVRDLLRVEIAQTLAKASSDGEGIAEDRTAVVLMIGVNGSGKTTSIAKLAHAAKEQGRSVLLAAADTFRAGAIEQIREWGNRLEVDVIAHTPGADPGAVAFDAIAAARARGVDLVLVDTAGRLHTRHNLMEELKKVNRVVESEAGDYTRRALLVIDSATGQNGLLQARAFNEAIGCDGVFLTKLDGTAKGGIVLAIAGELGLPVWFIGTGETLDDLSTFDPVAFAGALLPEPADAA